MRSDMIHGILYISEPEVLRSSPKAGSLLITAAFPKADSCGALLLDDF